jgi:hypothetical protein
VADFGITYPGNDGVKVTLVRRKGKKYQQYFAIGGFGKGRAKKPQQAVLVADGNDPDNPANHLYYGNLFREMPGQDTDETNNTEWAMWFNLEDLDLGTAQNPNKFDLHVYGKKRVKLLARLHLTFTLQEIERRSAFSVEVIFPDGGGPYCQDGFTPYGIFTPPDTSIVRVEMITVSGTTITIEGLDSSPYVSREGFWSACFSGLDPAKTYRARAVGDVNTSAPSPEFTVQAC